MARNVLTTLGAFGAGVVTALLFRETILSGARSVTKSAVRGAAVVGESVQSFRSDLNNVQAEVQSEQSRARPSRPAA